MDRDQYIKENLGLKTSGRKNRTETKFHKYVGERRGHLSLDNGYDHIDYVYSEKGLIGVLVNPYNSSPHFYDDLVVHRVFRNNQLFGFHTPDNSGLNDTAFYIQLTPDLPELSTGYKLQRYFSKPDGNHCFDHCDIWKL